MRTNYHKPQPAGRIRMRLVLACAWTYIVLAMVVPLVKLHLWSK